MDKKSIVWKKGRGRLGIFQPLLGRWVAEAEGPMGKATCTRTLNRILAGKYIQLRAHWQLEKGVYEELALFGVDAGGKVGFWSFTSDGKQSQGRLADVSDIHPQAVGFEAQMPAGLARNAYWPDAAEGFHWAVESRTKQGWNRFLEHHYRTA